MSAAVILFSFWRMRNVSAGPTTLKTHTYTSLFKWTSYNFNNWLTRLLQQSESSYYLRTAVWTVTGFFFTWCWWSCGLSGESYQPAVPTASLHRWESGNWQEHNKVDNYNRILKQHLFHLHSISFASALTCHWWKCNRTPPWILYPPPTAAHAPSRLLQLLQEQPEESGGQRVECWCL